MIRLRPYTESKISEVKKMSLYLNLWGSEKVYEILYTSGQGSIRRVFYSSYNHLFNYVHKAEKFIQLIVTSYLEHLILYSYYYSISTFFPFCLFFKRDQIKSVFTQRICKHCNC